MDSATLPGDTVFKDVERVVVQDLVLQVETCRFEKEVWYSPRQHRSYRQAIHELGIAPVFCGLPERATT